MNVRVAVVAEAPRDAVVVRCLARRIAREVLEPSAEVELVGPKGSPESIFLRWQSIEKSLLRKYDVKPQYGGFDGKRRPDELRARNALRILRAWLHKKEHLANVVVLQRDLDKEPDRLNGLQQAAEYVPLNGIPVVIGAADPKVESWAICAIEPADKAARDRLKAEKTNLGFDPREGSHKLDASTHGAKRDAKRVLAALVDPEDDPFAALEEHTPIEILKQRGHRNGLRRLLDDLEMHVGALTDR